MSARQRANPFLKRESPGDCPPQEASELHHQDPSAPVTGQDHATAKPVKETIEPEETRHVGRCFLGLGLDCYLQRHVEAPWEYLPGGHHPVHLGDRIGKRRQYRVIHKLGTGGFGNVWLCHLLGTDPTMYLAVKILKAEFSGEDCKELSSARRLQKLADNDPGIEQWCFLPWQTFQIEGPNGTHQCFVYEVAGPGVAEIETVVPDVNKYLRSLTRQAALALSKLHEHDICHGDFRPSNILLKLDGLDGKSEKEVIEILGEPEGATVIKYRNAHPEANPPRYILNPVSFDREKTSKLCRRQLCIVDFGESFVAGNSPPGGTGIPYCYAGPEVILEQWSGKESDIFALAMTMYEIRFGLRLFEVDGRDLDDYLFAIVKDFGKLPEDWWWDKWKETWAKYCKRIMACSGPKHADEVWEEPTVRRRRIHEAVRYPVGHYIRLPNEPEEWHEQIPQDEQELFADLLYKMTELDPDKRLTVEEAMEHPWFYYEMWNSAQDKTQDPHEVEDNKLPSDPASGQQQVTSDFGSPDAGAPESQGADIDMLNTPEPTQSAQTESVHAEQPGFAESDKPESINVDKPQPPVADGADKSRSGATEAVQPTEDTEPQRPPPVTDKLRLTDAGNPQPSIIGSRPLTEDYKLLISTELSPAAEMNGAGYSAVESFRSTIAVKSIPSHVESARTADSSARAGNGRLSRLVKKDTPPAGTKTYPKNSKFISIFHSVRRIVRAVFA
ncbi:kinase-like domain-containing protein [Aspergillus navahoensis]